MNVKSNVKGGIIADNHNETLVRIAAPSLAVKTNVKGGVAADNHNQTQVRVARKA
jgi:hypothetical protein